MAIAAEILEAEVLHPPELPRSRLLDKLIARLDATPEWGDAWTVEAHRREPDVAADKAAWIPGYLVLARTRVKLA
jgi:hypothetical protein